MRIAVFALAAATVTGLSFGGYHYHQRHMSSDFKRIMVAAMDPAITENDLHIYVRDARLQVRTKRDQEVLDELQQAIATADAAESEEKLSSESLDEAMHDSERGLQLAMEGLHESHDVWEITKKQMAQVKADEDRESKDADEFGKMAKNTRLAGLKRWQHLRADIGMPPMPELTEMIAKLEKEAK